MIAFLKFRKDSGHRSRRQERGVALVLALISLLVLSLLAAGMISSTQSEIWGTASYRKTAQARYVAEAGAQQAVYWITKSFGDLATNNGLGGSYFTLGVTPVVYNPTAAGVATPKCSPGTLTDLCVLRMTTTTPPSGGLTDTIKTFDAASQKLESGFATAVGDGKTSFAGINGSYAVAAQLISASYNATAQGWLTKWKITSQGKVGAVQPATVQVVEVIENILITGGTTPPPLGPINNGAFATSPTCGAITINGGSWVASYNSATQSGNKSPTESKYGGSIGTLGNVSLSGGAYVYGNVYAPGYNLGNSKATVYYPYGVSGGGSWPYNNGTEACSSSKMYAVNEDNSGSAIQCVNATSGCGNKASALPSSISSSTYTSASYMVGTTQVTPPANTNSCSSYSVICGGGSGYYDSSLGKYVSTLTMAPSSASNVVNYGQVSFGGSTTTTLNAGSYFFDTLNVGGGSSVKLGSGPVVVYILNDKEHSTQPVNITGGSFSNSGGTPSQLALVYNGTQTIHIGGISNYPLFGVIYAPNAKIVFDGNGSIYGAVIGKTVSITGGGHIIYDTALGTTSPPIYPPGQGLTVSPHHLTDFSWSVY